METCDTHGLEPRPAMIRGLFTMLVTLALASGGCASGPQVPRHRGPLSIEGIALGQARNQLTASGWKAEQIKGQEYLVPNGDAKHRVQVSFSADGQVTGVEGTRLEDEQGTVLLQSSQLQNRVVDVLGPYDSWERPDRQPGFGDPPSRSVIHYLALQLEIETDLREMEIRRFRLMNPSGQTPVVK